MNPTHLEIAGSFCFLLALLHTFSVKKIASWSHRFPTGSVAKNLWHFAAEVEIVFGLWAAAFLCYYSLTEGFASYDDSGHLVSGALSFLEQQNYTESVFVFVIMSMAGTYPILYSAKKLMLALAKFFPFPPLMSLYVTTLILGPLLGSFITEPAAMTVTALLLAETLYQHKLSEKWQYATLGLLFVNISIGGTLTHFAAPPVLMVAHKWQLNLPTMMTHFGYKAFLAMVLSTSLTAYYFRRELSQPLTLKNEQIEQKDQKEKKAPWWVVSVHLLFIILTVMTAHHMVFFLGLFLFFLGWVQATQEYQKGVPLQSALLVGFFLAGLVTLGSMQAWWLKNLLGQLNDFSLYIGATLLTGVTDNAALTYLGSLVDLSDSAKYYLLSGAVIGGGLTVIANAPNPVGYGVLKQFFPEGEISAAKLFLAALIPTLIPLVLFYFLPPMSLGTP